MIAEPKYKVRPEILEKMKRNVDIYCDFTENGYNHSQLSRKYNVDMEVVECIIDTVEDALKSESSGGVYSYLWALYHMRNK